ncbi:PEP phosphonomutase family protein [Enterococcus faecalis]|nr:PEP phosphonomutase family protein [Enterococcus faecalis DENG1]OJG32322.1 PEP phosphonomutase [Enterococcus devriesei]OSH06697.1 PEP phosphonomutase family protein [Enterococcus faecalis]OSH21193.1 PEP phosphonomutase family protein [Enterococcus faecalis]OSH36877.1 PEP phosphonomutase family protein [Enterococcus faecalis]
MELKQAILASEGRTVMAENVASSSNFLAGVTNAELERAAGADLILFNALDLFDPQIVGIPDNIEESPVEWIKKAIGRPIGVNLEPVDIKASMNEARSEISIGRIVSPKTLKQANKLGFNFICLTGNPGTGVTNDAIKHAIELSREHFDGLIIAGKMHGAGVDEPVMNLEIAKQFVETGIDMLLVPAPYTVPYFMEQDLKEIADYVRSHNKGKSIEDKVLLLTANGTSQDSSDSDTIKKIALASKACGADIQHIGDSLNGICLPENIFALGQAIRGYRHQMVMLGKSNLR